MMTVKSLRLMFVALAGVLLLAGCGVYTDITDSNSATKGHDPNSPHVQNIMTQGLKAAVDEWQYEGGYAFLLPPGTEYQTYQNVYIGLGNGPTLDSDTGHPVLKIEEIRARGYVAEIDISRPVDALYPDGERQLVTAYMKCDPMSGWLANYVKTWLPGVGDLNQDVVAIDIEALRVVSEEPVKQKLDEEELADEQANEQQAPVEQADDDVPVEEIQTSDEVEQATE